EAAEIASARAVSLTTASSRPCRLIRGAFRAGGVQHDGPDARCGPGVSSVRRHTHGCGALWTARVPGRPAPMPRDQGLRPRGWRRDRPPGPAAVAAGTVTRTRPAVAGLPGRAPDARPFRPRARVRRRGPVGLPAPDVPPQPPCAVVVRAVAVRGRSGGPRGG